MANKYIVRLITKFFENDLPNDIQLRFRRWFLLHGSEDEKREVLYDIWENHTRDVDANTPKDLDRLRQRIDRFENRRTLSLYKRIARIAAILLLPLLSAVATYYIKQDVIQISEPEMVECFVPYGERKYVLLSDGSEVWVNAGSLLVYAKEFTGNTRSIYLNGEANFKVAKDPDKPFIVKTEYMDIEALGTVFNVQSYPDTKNSIATLEHGKIKICTKQSDMLSFILYPDEQVIYNRTTKKLIKQKVDATKNNQWKMGYLVFQGNTFDEIMKSIERKFGVTVSYNNDKFVGRTFTIRFSPDEDLRQVFDIMKVIGNFKYQIKDNVIYIN